MLQTNVPRHTVASGGGDVERNGLQDSLQLGGGQRLEQSPQRRDVNLAKPPTRKLRHNERVLVLVLLAWCCMPQ